MKKFFIGICTLIGLLTVKVQGAEIIPEYFLMERLIMLMDVAPTYVKINGNQELKAIQIDNKIMDILGNSENPFYIYDSNGEQKIVRVGDYFYSPTTLSSIYSIDKDSFENNYRNKALPEKSLKTTVEETDDKINISDIDEGATTNINEN